MSNINRPFGPNKTDHQMNYNDDSNETHPSRNYCGGRFYKPYESCKKYFFLFKF